MLRTAGSMGNSIVTFVKAFYFGYHLDSEKAVLE